MLKEQLGAIHMPGLAGQIKHVSEAIFSQGRGRNFLCQALNKPLDAAVHSTRLNNRGMADTCPVPLQVLKYPPITTFYSQGRHGLPTCLLVNIYLLPNFAQNPRNQ